MEEKKDNREPSGNDSAKKISPGGRKPAPALLGSNEEASQSGPRLSLSLDNLGGGKNSASLDPLSPPPSFPSSAAHRSPPNDPPPSVIQMSDSQLQSALERWDGEEEDNEGLGEGDWRNAIQNWFCCFQADNSTATESTPQPPRTDAQIVSGSVACLCSATLGAGILSLPYAMAEAGLFCGMTLLILSALATAHSIQLLVQAMQVVYFNHPDAPIREKTYEDLVERILGKQWRKAAEACMLLFCGGAAVAYVIAVGDILQQARLTRSRGLAQTLAWATAMVPLSMLKTMKSLECASSIGISSICTLVLAALYHYATHPGEQAPQSELWWSDEHHQSVWAPTQGMLSVLRACPIILFAFSCQVNVCAIYDEMPGQQLQQQPPPVPQSTDDINNQEEEEEEAPTPTAATATTKYRRMNQVTYAAVGICALLYASISIVALADFGSSKMTPNILTSYNPESVMLVAFIGMTLAVTLAYPMNIFPARVTLLGIVRGYRRRRARDAAATTETTNDLEEPLLPAENGSLSDLENEEEGSIRALSEVSDSTPVSVDPFGSGSVVEHVVATLFLTSLSLGLALVAPNISVVFGLLGGTSSSVLGFVIPGLLGYHTANEFYAGSVEAAKTARTISLTLVVSGVVVGIVTTAVTVYSTFAS